MLPVGFEVNNMAPSTNMTATSSTPFRAHVKTVEVAGNLIDRFIARDSCLPNLTSQLQLTPECKHFDFLPFCELLGVFFL